MGKTGEELRAAREGKGLSYKQISERTRISTSFLKALEEEDYSHIPGEVFVTGFLRTYANELGLDTARILRMYKESRPAEAPEAEQKAESARFEKLSIFSAATPKKLTIPVIVIAGLALGVILTGVALHFTRPSQAPAPVTPVKTTAPNPFTPATASVFRQATSGAAKGPAGPAPAVNPPVSTGQTGRLSLKLTAMEPSWYSYGADGGGSHHGTLSKGAVITIDAGERIDLDLGNPGGIKAEFNGNTLEPLGNRGVAVIGIVFNKEGKSNSRQGRVSRAGTKNSEPAR